jgi:hypothetical protein
MPERQKPMPEEVKLISPEGRGIGAVPLQKQLQRSAVTWTLITISALDASTAQDLRDTEPLHRRY